MTTLRLLTLLWTAAAVVLMAMVARPTSPSPRRDVALPMGQDHRCTDRTPWPW